MDVRIRERKFSFFVEYDIQMSDRELYAKKEWLSFNDKIKLQTSTGESVARIRGYFSPIHNRHDFLMADGRAYHFHCEKIWKQVYQCEGNGEKYRLLTHRGLKYSIFRDDRQIAAIERNRVVVGNGNEYSIQMDFDANPTVVVCMMLTVNSSDDKNDNSVTIDFGNIGPQERQFDSSWRPR